MLIISSDVFGLVC